MTRTGVAISAFWFCAMGALGIFFPFFSLYLRENVGLPRPKNRFVASDIAAE